MQTLFNILGEAIYFVGSFFISLIIVRVILQKVRADFYNPISKGIVAITNPVVVPVRKVIPGFFGLDMASILVAFLLQVLMNFLIHLLQDSIALGPVYLLLRSLFELLDLVLIIYLFSIIILAIASWVAPQNYNPAVSLIQQMVEPVMRPFRRLIPPMGGIDFSPMLLCFVIYILRKYGLPALASLF